MDNENENQQKQNENQKVQFHFTHNKAGMTGYDKEKIEKIVYEASKESEYYKRQQEKKDKYVKKIDEMKFLIKSTKVANLNINIPKDYRDIQGGDNGHILTQICIIDIVIFQSNHTKKQYIHMFYIAVEVRDNSQLEGKPCAVGGNAMLSTANYIARKFGVRSAMPGFIAKKLCPDLIIVSPNFHKYQEASQIFKKILYKYDPELESMGLDEANLDLTTYLQENNLQTCQQIQDLCNDIRQQINEATKLTCSAGIGPNKMLAKICSDINKPNGQYFIENDVSKITEFMSQLSVRKIPGIGNVSEQLLAGLDINTCQNLLDRKYELRIVFNDGSFEFFIQSALGIGRNYHEQPEDQKSISVSRTFPIIHKKDEMIDKLKELAKHLEYDMQESSKLGKLMTLAMKSHKFESKTRQMQLERYIDNYDDILKFSIQILNKFEQQEQIEPLRLLGIKLGDLIDKQTYNKNTIVKYFKGSKSKQENQQDPQIVNQNIEESDDSLQEILKIAEQYKKKQIPKNLQIQEYNQLQKQIDENNGIQDQNIDKMQKQIIQQQNKQKIKQNLEVTQPEQKNCKSFICPICSEEIDCNFNNVRMNNHITQCLEGKERKEQEIPKQLQNNKSKRDSGPENIQQNENKKRKTTPIKNQAKKRLNQNNTLDCYFKK